MQINTPLWLRTGNHMRNVSQKMSPELSRFTADPSRRRVFSSKSGLTIWVLALAVSGMHPPDQAHGQVVEQRLMSFGFLPDAARPCANLIQTTDGALYGTTSEGGTDNVGTVFKLNTTGSGYSVVYRFNGKGGGGQNPKGLLQGSDDVLYGTTQDGGTYGFGTVFTLRTNGSGYTVLYNFTGKDGDGSHPVAGLCQRTVKTSQGGSNENQPL